MFVKINYKINNIYAFSYNVIVFLLKVVNWIKKNSYKI